MGLFDKRIAFRPYEYPEIIKFKDAISHSFWLVSEWNFLSDIHDFMVKLDDRERNAIKNTLLAISQIEVAVKKFWVNMGDRFPKPEFDLVGITCGESECFDGKTEVLTNLGWKRFKDLTTDDLVAQYDMLKSTITFAKPVNYITRKYEGVMHHYDSNGTDIMVTPKHELIVAHLSSPLYVKKKSEDGKWDRNYGYPCAGLGISSNPLVFSELDRLLIALQAGGALLADGRRDFLFVLKKKGKINRVKDILHNLDIDYQESEKNGATIINGLLPNSVPDVFSIENFAYIDLAKVDSKYARSFIEELSHWDSDRQAQSFVYYHTNIEAVDKVQAIAILANLLADKGIDDTKEYFLWALSPDGNIKKNKTCYAVNICEINKKIYPSRNEVNYKGMVYCVEMPLGTVVTRRNKKVAITGNCRHAEAYAHLLQVLNLNDDFDALLSVPAIRGRVDYLQKYLSKASSLENKEYALTLTLFSLFIENVSLFSQFAIIKAFNKHKSMLKDIDNVVQATQKEEQIHALLGIYIVNEIRKEYPEWFTEEFYQTLYDACQKSFEAESNIIEWIFEKGELDFITKADLKEFIKSRFNESLEMIGGKAQFVVDQDAVNKFDWFNEEIYGQVNTDFFHKKPVTYSKKVQAITAEDLF